MKLINFVIIFLICNSISYLNSLDILQNDNYCDNGDDEPKTSACSGLLTNTLLPTFTCLDQDYYIEKIFASHVNDGIILILILSINLISNILIYFI